MRGQPGPSKDLSGDAVHAGGAAAGVRISDLLQQLRARRLRLVPSARFSQQEPGLARALPASQHFLCQRSPTESGRASDAEPATFIVFPAARSTTEKRLPQIRQEWLREGNAQKPNMRLHQ